MEQGVDATRKMASSAEIAGGVNSGRNIGSGGNQHAYSDHVDRVATGVGHLLVPTQTTPTAVSPSLSLLDSVLAMRPSHHAALRCRATTLARLGRTSEALVTAGRAVIEAEAAVRASAAKGADAGLGGGTSLAAPVSASASATVINGDDNRRSFPQPSPTAAAGTYSGKKQHIPSGFGAKASASAANGVTGAMAGSTPSTMAGASVGAGVGAGVSGYGGGNSCGVQQRPCDSASSIGFMRSSKVDVVVGGLLPTGGGRADILDIAKSLVLRGCLRQKLGRTKQAEEDYQQALGICHSRLKNIEACLENNATKLDNNGGHGHGDQSWAVGSTVGEEPVTRGRKKAFGGRGGRWSKFERSCVLDDTATFDENDAPREGCLSGLSPLHDTKGGCEDVADVGNPPFHQEGCCKVMKLESLIHHNLATLHLAALLRRDSHVSFRKVCSTIVFGNMFFRREHGIRRSRYNKYQY